MLETISEEEYIRRYGKESNDRLNANSLYNSKPKPKKSVGDVVQSIFPGKEIGKSLVQAGSNIKNLATGGRAKYEQGLKEGNKVNVPALIGDYMQAGVALGGAATPVSKAKPVISGGMGGRGAVPFVNPPTLGAKAAALGKNTAKGAAEGYVFDVGGNLKEGKTGMGLAKPGLGTAFGAAIPPVATGVGAAARGVKGAAATLNAPKDPKAFALELTSPKITKGLAEDAIRMGSTRVKEGKGLFQRTELLPNARDMRIAASVEDVVDPNKRLIENVDAINRKVSELNKGVTEYVRTNKAIFNENQLRSKIAEAKQNSNLLFAGDEAAERAYDAVIEEFIRQIGRKDTEGLFLARQEFDRYLKTKLPNLFKKDATGQFLDPRDNIRMNASLDVRRAVNEYIADLLPEGNIYKETLRRESDMLEALARIAEKNAGKISRKNLRILMQKHPVLTFLTQTAATFALGGTAVGVANAASQ